MTHIYSDAEIERIALCLLDRSLPKREWTHAAHFAAAFWFLRQAHRNADRDMPGLIRAYNESTGVPNTDSSGYHETITLASLRAARAWLAARPAMTPHEALAEMLTSELGNPDWILAYCRGPRCSRSPRVERGSNRSSRRCPFRRAQTIERIYRLHSNTPHPAEPRGGS